MPAVCGMEGPCSKCHHLHSCVALHVSQHKQPAHVYQQLMNTQTRHGHTNDVRVPWTWFEHTARLWIRISYFQICNKQQTTHWPWQYKVLLEVHTIGYIVLCTMVLQQSCLVNRSTVRLYGWLFMFFLWYSINKKKRARNEYEYEKTTREYMYIYIYMCGKYTCAKCVYT